MAFDRTDTFTLSRNERREKDTHPDFTGSLNVDGVEYWLNAWTKELNGRKFFSGTVKRKDPVRSPITDQRPAGAVRLRYPVATIGDPLLSGSGDMQPSSLGA